MPSSRNMLRLSSVLVQFVGATLAVTGIAAAASPGSVPVNQAGISIVSAQSNGSRNAAADAVPPADDGALLASSPVAKPPTGSIGFQIRYRSYSMAGAPIEVTGVAFVPARTAPKGGWPVLSYAHGTVGLADACTPSKNLTMLENILAGTFNALGIAVVQSDYEGLGTDGRHPYLVGISEGRSVLDAAKAIRSLPGQSVSNRLVVWGHSQGGHAALFAAELAKRWAPQLVLKGVVAGAPPSQLGTISTALTKSPYRGYLLMVAAGLAQAYPNLDLSTVLTPKGMEVLPVVDKGCNAEVFAQANLYPLAELVNVAGLKDQQWAQALAENEPGVRKIDAPVFMIHGDADEQVPVQTSAALAQKMCANGTSVQRRVYAGADHGGAALLSLIDVSAWLKDRLDGKAAPKGCR